jgi:uncharacterized protein YcfJ
VKKTGLVLLSVTVLFAGAGCQSSPNRTGEGALIGGLVGAGAGAIIGNQGAHRNRDRTSGALLGGALGALGGALVGSQVQKQPQQQAQVNNPNQMAVQQIVDMSKQGVNEDVIVDRIRMSNSRFTLSSNDISYLQGQGVSQKVISAMQGY